MLIFGKYNISLRKSCNNSKEILNFTAFFKNDSKSNFLCVIMKLEYSEEYGEESR